uniref:RRM domain-containing protein n=1 Tax=Macrostomum lignano TaxID=282301 RepID=A0A1I8F711_9PLAT
QRDASPSLLHGVRVRGLPWSANDTDLAEFFAPLKPCLATVARSAMVAAWAPARLPFTRPRMLRLLCSIATRSLWACRKERQKNFVDGSERAASSAAAAVQPMRSPWRLAQLRPTRAPVPQQAVLQPGLPAAALAYTGKSSCVLVSWLAAQLSWADFMQRLGPHIHTPPVWSLATPVPGIPVFMYSSLDEPPELLSPPNRPGMSESLLALGRPVPASLSELVERPRCAARFGQSIGPDLSQGEPVAWFGLFLRALKFPAASSCSRQVLLVLILSSTLGFGASRLLGVGNVRRAAEGAPDGAAGLRDI